MVLSVKSWEQIDHTAEEGATRRDDFAYMLKIAKKRLQLLPCEMVFFWPGDQECVDTIKFFLREARLE